MDLNGTEGIEQTNTDLLLGLCDRENDRVWTEFCDRYLPILESFGQRLGLTHEDASDAAQEALSAFAAAYRRGDYDRTRGHLRTWLFGIATNKIRDVQRGNHRWPSPLEAAEGGQGANEVPDDHTMSDLWEAEWQQAVLSACLEEVYREVKLSTARAFELFVLKEWPVDKVAAELGLTRNAVFKAQRRVLSRLRELHGRLNEEW